MVGHHFPERREEPRARPGNGNNAASSTWVSFSAAGNYTLTVKIADRQGLFVHSSVSVAVSQTLTQMVLSPPIAFLADGGSQQFAAVGLDQFGNVLASHRRSPGRRPARSDADWLIHSAEHVRQRHGHCAAVRSRRVPRLPVSRTNFLGMSNAALAGGSRKASSSGTDSITRNDMLEILDSVAQTGSVVNASEFSSLQTIVGDGSLLKMPNYVQVLAADVVDGNVANAHYRGNR